MPIVAAGGIMDGKDIKRVIKMGAKAAWWNGVDKGLMKNIIGKIHPGAIKYYSEAGFSITAAQK